MILAVGRLLGLVMRRVGQPQVMGEVVGGILLGPSLLGWLAPGASAERFPPEATLYLKVLSEYGIVFFMFLVGLELDPALIRGRGGAAVVTSHTSIVVPFVLGVLLASQLYGQHAALGVPFWSFALFMGAAMSITAFPVLARILIKRDLLKTRVGAVTIVAAAVDDVTAWCLLAFVVAVVRTADVREALSTLGLVLGYVAFMLVVQPLLRRFSAMVDHAGRLTQGMVAAVFLLVLGSAIATDEIGIHALATTPILAWLYPPERFRAELAVTPATRAVLAAVALPSSGPLLVDLSADLADAPESPLYLLHLARPPERGTLGLGPASRTEDESALAPSLARARARGIEVRALQFVSRNPANDISDVARAKGAGLIVMGWHKPVWSRTVLGGTVHRVMREADGEVVVFIRARHHLAATPHPRAVQRHRPGSHRRPARVAHRRTARRGAHRARHCAPGLAGAAPRDRRSFGRGGGQRRRGGIGVAHRRGHPRGRAARPDGARRRRELAARATCFRASFRTTRGAVPVIDARRAW